MGVFISVQKTVECIVAAIIFSAAFSATFYKVLGILQSLGYSGRKLFGWVRKRNNSLMKRQILLFMICALSCAVFALCFSFAGEYAAVVSLIPYILFFILYVVADKKVALRSPATPTPRFKRLYVVLFTLIAVLCYLAITLLNFADYLIDVKIFNILRYLPLSIFPLVSVPLVSFANLVCKIYEVPHNKSYVRSAQKKIAAAKLKTVGITGSYGKTSTKNILSKMLSYKYRVLSTPRSHNTPLGLALTINSNDLSKYDIFIAEMGARNLGDIEELCAICPPDYSIITGICPQHLESFGSEENIIKAKGEILSATKEKAVIAADCYSKFEGFDCNKIKCECVSDAVCFSDGTEFTLTLGGESRRIKTKLLGVHSAQNIAVAAELAFILGLSFDEICMAAEELDFVEHRLQLIKNNGVNILDDGYNSNVKGAAAALEVLRTFAGRKIAVTPGLVELGILEESENYLLGKELVGLDKVILVGETLITPVKKGYLENSGDARLIQTVPTLFAAQELLKEYIKPGDTVLFLNDLPDIY